MKKYLPLILLAVGILVVVGAFFVVRGRGKDEEFSQDEETALLNVPLEERPVLSLTPSEDGHYLILKVEKITIDAVSVDYELLYDTADSVTQGVPGAITLSGIDNFEEELLLGSESSGKFRYDEGVEKGQITLRFRNDDGKLLVKFMSDFHLQRSSTDLSTQDGAFKYSLDEPGDAFFVTMHTVGYPGDAPAEVKNGPFGVFSSSSDAFSGNVDLSGTVYRYNGSDWEKIDGSTSEDIGIFISS